MGSFNSLSFLLSFLLLGTLEWGGLSREALAQGVVKKVCSRIEGIFVPCGGGGGGCGCPTRVSCDSPTFDFTCVSDYDGSEFTQTCPTCCFDDQCDAVKDTMECTQTKSICGQSCRGTKARTSCSGGCNTYKESIFTLAVFKTTNECLEERETETFSCASAGSSDGCNCSCRQSGDSCQPSSTGTCGPGQCSCGKTGVMKSVNCLKYKRVCERMDTKPCRVVDMTIPKVPGPNCDCVCPSDFVPSPPEILMLPLCGGSSTCTPGECLNCK